jgi:hypothetical protein
MTFAPVDAEKAKEIEEKQKRDKIIGKEWSYPGVTSAVVSNLPKKPLDEATLDELKTVI